MALLSCRLTCWTLFDISPVIYKGLGAIVCPGTAQGSSPQAEFRMLEGSVLFLISDTRFERSRDEWKKGGADEL